MKILYITPAYKPAYRFGGPVPAVASAAELLIKKGHSVTVVTTNSNLDEDLDVPLNQPVTVDGVEVWYFRREEPIKKWLPFIPYLAQSSGFLYAPEMKRYLPKIMSDADVVHVHLPFQYPTFFGGKTARRLKKPLYYSQHGVFDPNRISDRALKKRAFMRLFERDNLRYTSGLMALTQREEMSYRLLGLENPVYIVPNGIDVAAMRQTAIEDMEAKWNIPVEATVVLFLGRLHSSKGADKLLEAFLQVGEKIPNAVLVMAGPDELGLQASFRERVGQTNLQDRVIFPGMVSGDTKLDLFARADLFCLPSKGEGFSIAVLEALASRTAVLLSDECFFPEAAQAGAGVILEPGAKTAEIAQKLVELTNAPENLKEMAKNGLQLVKTDYTWDRVTDLLLQAYAQRE